MLAHLSEFFFGGTCGFNDAEARIIAFVADSLPVEEGLVLRHQVKAVRKVQRQSPGRLVVAFYKERDSVPPLPYPGYEHCLANVTYTSRGRSKTTSLVLHQGRFMSFERNVPQTMGDIEAIQSVTLHPKGFESIAQEIDAEEHRQGQA